MIELLRNRATYDKSKIKKLRDNFDKDLVDKGRDVNFVKQVDEEKCNEVYNVCEENLVIAEVMILFQGNHH